MTDVTTLQLAERIADAVIEAYVERLETLRIEPDDSPTQAVLRTLREHSIWFCRVTHMDADGTIDGKAQTPLLPFEG